MLTRIRRLSATSGVGFTMIELLIVVVLIGILLAIAVPSYLSFRNRTADEAAKRNLKSALPAAANYFADHDTYAGMNRDALKAIDGGVSDTLKVTEARTTSFTLCDDPNGRAWQVVGPAASASDYTPVASC